MRANSVKLFKSFENDVLDFVKILKSSVNKFTIDPLQQRFHTVLLVSFYFMHCSLHHIKAELKGIFSMKKQRKIKSFKIKGTAMHIEQFVFNPRKLMCRFNWVY